MNTSPPTTKTSYTSTVATGHSLHHIYPHLSTQEQDAAPVDHFHFKASQYHLVSQQTFNFSLMIKLFLLYRSFLKNEPYTLLCCKTAQSSLLNSIQEHSFQQNLRKKLKICKVKEIRDLLVFIKHSRNRLKIWKNSMNTLYIIPNLLETVQLFNS